MPTFLEFQQAARYRGWTLVEAHGSLGMAYALNESSATVALLAFHDGEALELGHVDVEGSIASTDAALQDFMDPYRDVLARTWEVASAISEERRGPVGDERQALSDEYVAAAVGGFCE